MLQLTALAIGAAKSILDWRHMVDVSQGAAEALLTALFTLALLGFLTWKVAEGRNWARITLLVFFVLGAVPYVFVARGELHRSVSLAAVGFLQVGMQVGALLLVFKTPGRFWFAKRTRYRPTSQV